MKPLPNKSRARPSEHDYGSNASSSEASEARRTDSRSLESQVGPTTRKRESHQRSLLSWVVLEPALVFGHVERSYFERNSDLREALLLVWENRRPRTGMLNLETPPWGREDLRVQTLRHIDTLVRIRQRLHRHVNSAFEITKKGAALPRRQPLPIVTIWF